MVKVGARKPIYLDACAIIELLEKQSSVSVALGELLAATAGQPPYLLTSELTLSEVLVEPIRGVMDATPWQDHVPFSREHHDWYMANLTDDSVLIRTLPVARSVLTRAALMRARVRSLRAPDQVDQTRPGMGTRQKQIRVRPSRGRPDRSTCKAV